MEKFRLFVTLSLSIFTILLLTSVQAESEDNLSSEAVSEGKCLKNPKIFSQTNFTWVVQPRVFYVPMASEHYYRHFAEAFLNRSIESEDELDDMNLRIDVVYSRLAYLGYKQHFVQLCLPILGYGRLNCTFVTGSKGVNPKTVENTVDTIVWTDNSSAMLLARCVNGRRKNWKVVAVDPELEPGVEEKVLSIIDNLGFNKTLVARRI